MKTYKMEDYATSQLANIPLDDVIVVLLVLIPRKILIVMSYTGGEEVAKYRNKKLI